MKCDTEKAAYEIVRQEEKVYGFVPKAMPKQPES
jgi:hypothetical protein